MADLPAVGDPVTIVLRQTGGAGHRKVCDVDRHTTHTGKPLRSCFYAFDNQGHINFLDDEGTTWLRGHVPLDAPEVKAMLASYALDTHFAPLMCGMNHPHAKQHNQASVFCSRPAWHHGKHEALGLGLMWT